MRQCPQCNRVYGLDITFCLHDGALLDDKQDLEQTIIKPSRVPTPTLPAPTQATQIPRPSPPISPPLQIPIHSPTLRRKENRKALKIIATALLIAIAVLSGLYFLFLPPESTNTQTSPTPAPLPTATPTPSTVRRQAYDGIVRVPMTNYIGLPVDVPNNVTSARLTGGFRTTNNHSGVQVYVFSQHEFGQWMNRQTANYFYFSDYAANKRFSCFVAGGLNYVVLNNGSVDDAVVAIELFLEF